jgi:hypothetical protein
VSIYPTPKRIVREKAGIHEALDDRHTVHFFDSRTHPLGDPALHVG